MQYAVHVAPLNILAAFNKQDAYTYLVPPCNSWNYWANPRSGFGNCELILLGIVDPGSGNVLHVAKRLFSHRCTCVYSVHMRMYMTCSVLLNILTAFNNTRVPTRNAKKFVALILLYPCNYRNSVPGMVTGYTWCTVLTVLHRYCSVLVSSIYKIIVVEYNSNGTGKRIEGEGV